MNNSPQLTPDLPEPTDLEVEQTKRLINDKYDIVMPEAEIERLVTLIKELEWWQKAGDKSNSSQQFSREQLTDLQELLEDSGSHSLSQLDVHDHAKSLLAVVPTKEKQRIADEIRGVLVEYRPVPYEPVIIEKTTQLLKSRYGLELTDEQLEQLIPFLAKTLWYNEGLDSSLEQCLVDLILVTTKQESDSTFHAEIRKSLDLAISQLSSKE